MARPANPYGPALPQREGAARARLAAVGAARAPVVLARDRSLAVAGPLGTVLPSVQRGSVVVVGGPVGSGATTTVLGIAAAATTVGEWAGMVDGPSTLGGLAAAEAGVDLARFAVIRRVPPDRWPTVVAALLDGMSVVVASVPRGLRTGDARRLVARARERAAVLVALASDARGWPVEGAVRIEMGRGTWSGLGRGEGLLAERGLTWGITGRAGAGRTHLGLAG